MLYPVIKLVYKQVIDAEYATDFERDVFEDSYQEFLMQAQAYNQENKWHTFQQMAANNPKANSLHYKVGFSVGLYIQQLNYIIPGLKDILGETPLKFNTCRFNIIESDISNKARHKIALLYTTGMLTYFGQVANNLWLSENEQPDTAAETETFLLPFVPGLSVCSHLAANSVENHTAFVAAAL